MLRVLITGASSGLGEALALEHAKAGDGLVLLARRQALLKGLAARCRGLGAPGVLVCAGDVSRRADLDRAVALAQRRLGSLDMAWANAGYSQSGEVEGLSLPQWRRQMAVNVEGVLHTAQACLPLLKASHGRLGVTGSVVGYGSMASSAAYAASKAAVKAMVQVLSLELEGSGVSVTLLSPGFFASEIRLKDPNGRPDPSAPEYIPAWLLGDVGLLAKEARQALMKRERELVWPLHAKLAVFTLRHCPGLARWFTRKLGREREMRKKQVQHL